MFTLPDTETNIDSDKKWVIKNCVEVLTLHRHNNAIEYCYNLSVSVSGSVNAPLVSILLKFNRLIANHALSSSSFLFAELF